MKILNVSMIENKSFFFLNKKKGSNNGEGKICKDLIS